MKRPLILILIVSLITAAHAFELKILDEIAPTAFLRWPSSSIPLSYVLDSKGSEDLSFSRTSAAVQEAFDSWQKVSRQFMRFAFAGARTPAVLNCSDRVNSLLWIESNWPHSSFVLAVTRTTFFLQEPAEFIDADIIFNGEDFRWSDTKEEGILQVQSVARHELGHMIGLEHSQFKGATMLPFGSEATALSNDEKGGIRFLYPAPPPASFKTLTPPGGVRILDETSSAFPPITFRWTAPAGFTNFILEFSRFNTFSPPSRVRTFAAGNEFFLVETPGMRKRIRKLAGDNQKLFWRLRADSPSGQLISKTSAFFFE